MESIKLTEDHKYKLLEMCKILFPEWTFVTFKESAIMGAGWDYDFNNICFSKKSETLFDIEINIHWFEFCLYYLVDKLFDDIKEGSYMTNKDFYRGGLVYRNHTSNPIDILYEEFKKLK